ncbi:Ig-like domain-containing protein [bacterium]|nr:Ig-like domain-containing protein [bacterium]
MIIYYNHIVGKKSGVFKALLSACVLFQFIIGCANFGPPPGGPADDTGPMIIAVNPPAGQTDTGLNTSIEIRVNEWYKSDSFRNAFFMSPEPESRIKFKFGLKKITVSFPGSLQPDQTYVMTIGADLADNQGNRMSHSYTSVFSTGWKLDYGLISGKAAEDKAGYIAALYPLDQDFLPLEKKGKYLTQSGEDGSFTLPYLPEGDYRLILFGDKDGDRIYDPGEEELGLPHCDIPVRNDSTKGLLIRTIKRDARPPMIRSVNPRNAETVEIVLDRKIEIPPSVKQIAIIDTLSGKPVDINRLYPHPVDSLRFILDTSALDTVKYMITISGGIDHWGMTMADTFFFTGVTEADTIAPALLEFEISSDSVDTRISVITSEPVVKNPLTRSVVTGDSLKDTLTFKVKEIFPGKYELKSAELAPGDTIHFRTGVLTDAAGNTAKDSVITRIVTPPPKPKEKLIGGSISGQLSFEGAGPVVIRLLKGNKSTAEIVRNMPGEFQFKDIESGFYSLEAFIDGDGSGRYSYGLLDPFTYSEKYTLAADSIRVRAKWETGGLLVKFD